MELTVQQNRTGNGALVLTLGGGITAGRCETLEKQVVSLIEAGEKRVVLDVTGITFLDSAGIGTLVACFSKLKKAGGDMRLAGAAGKVESVLKMTQVDRVVRFFPTAATAAADF